MDPRRNKVFCDLRRVLKVDRDYDNIDVVYDRRFQRSLFHQLCIFRYLVGVLIYILDGDARVNSNLQIVVYENHKVLDRIHIYV
jgi:hypothetical protein